MLHPVRHHFPARCYGERADSAGESPGPVLGAPQPQGRQRARRATSAVEFAFVAPVLFLLILSIIEFGRAFMVTELLNDAARRGCRAGVIPGTSTQQIKNTVNNYLPTVGLSGATVQVVVNDGSGTQEAMNVPTGTEITVSVTVPLSSVTWIPMGMQLSLPGVKGVAVGPTGSVGGQFTLRRE